MSRPSSPFNPHPPTANPVLPTKLSSYIVNLLLLTPLTLNLTLTQLTTDLLRPMLPLSQAPIFLVHLFWQTGSPLPQPMQSKTRRPLTCDLPFPLPNTRSGAVFPAALALVLPLQEVSRVESIVRSHSSFHV